jgi:hypothetical protein
MAALGGAAALFGGGKNDTPAPPPVVMPTAPTTARAPGADVKVGDTTAKPGTTATPDYAGFTEKRVFGKPLGGLGKGGLGL